ncbi:protein sprouty homolog 3 [Strongylocentrotus purpuratus]|uniref:Sprouty n=1 Tax=Strongylocentrotus purpuratus TaxID=7668 RepID=A0A7M7G3H4_STRPU|nr:protein sprouty homolog 3 [Strongylocentrotus purpuratus]|eukprot:XP_001176098.2 PREDICTED: protein sprouty homolog 3-like isoform X2 [Strongylocentrotus purpuratus]
MAQDGGDLVVRQPTSVHGSPPGSRPILLPPGWRNRNLLALRSATGDEARPNDYVDTNNDRLNGRNNNESPNSRSAENSGDEGHLRTDLIVVRGPKGKAKVLRVVKSKPDEKPKSKSEQSSPTTPTHGGDLHGKGDEKLSKDPFPCPQCGCCRCEKCKNSNRLPSTWCCNGRCEFSPECVLNCCTCMTCVKSLFYHCARESDTEYAYCTDDPCSCRPHRRCARWTCLSLLSLCLPCLCCYLPGRGALEAYRQCQSQGRQGCQCSRWENGEAYDAL